jgi:hypothetical protein
MKIMRLLPIVFVAICVLLSSTSMAVFAQDQKQDSPALIPQSVNKQGDQAQAGENFKYGGFKPYPSKKSFSGYTPYPSEGSFSGHSLLPSEKSFSGYSPYPSKGSYSGYSPFSSAEGRKPAPSTISPDRSKKAGELLGPRAEEQRGLITGFGPFAPGNPVSTFHSGPYAPDMEKAEKAAP